MAQAVHTPDALIHALNREWTGASVEQSERWK
jgi:hypothetical protein